MHRVAFFLVALLTFLVHVDAYCEKTYVRREWRTLTDHEQDEWIRAIKCLAKLPHDPALNPGVQRDKFSPAVNNNSAYYDDWVYVHINSNPVIHYTGRFLPWHRYYVYSLETTMRVKCGFQGTQPYWDWTKDARDLYNSDIFKGKLGGWGIPSEDYRVPDGAFSHDFKRAYPIPHPLRRNFTLRPFVDVPDFLFPDKSLLPNETLLLRPLPTSSPVEGGILRRLTRHWKDLVSIHGIVGCDLLGDCPTGSPAYCIAGPRWSPNDPLFFMHHAMIDKIWVDWQTAHPANKWAFRGGSISNITSAAAYSRYPVGMPPSLSHDSKLSLAGMFPDMTIGEVMDSQADLCYTYQ